VTHGSLVRTGGRVAGEVAVVTGAASGIGRACAELLAKQGATVVIADLDEEGAASVAKGMGDAALAYTVDVGDELSVSALFAAVLARYQRLDILVTCAALTDPRHQSQDRALGDLEASVWERTMAVDLGGTMFCCKHAVRAMAQGGSIVTISSNSALAGDLSLTAYAAAKAGVNALTRSIATAYGKAGIRANAVSPGSILSPSLQANVPADVVKLLHDNCLLPRMGTPEDVAAAVLFLASSESSFITGQVLSVDGGSLSQLPHVPPMRLRGSTTNAGSPA
jgi:NAD(P)-dependent dehydrogenase (short-subunit alcohol dehydrogenase family)